MTLTANAKPRNDRLRELLLTRKLTAARLAERLGVDPKSVERWVSTGRVPHPRTAYEAAQLLGVDITYLWPTIHNRRSTTIAGTDELVACWPGRAAVPLETWEQLLSSATRRITIMGDLGLPDLVPNICGLLADKGLRGITVRVILSDPNSCPNPIDTARAHMAHAVFRPLTGHRVTVSSYPGYLSTTILQVDDDLIVRTGIDGCPAAFAPVLHLKALPNGPLSRLYLTSLDTITTTALPITAVTR